MCPDDPVTLSKPGTSTRMHSPFIQQLEKNIARLLPVIESRGLRVDTGKMKEVIAGLREKRVLTEARAYELLDTPKRINLNSSAELADLLACLEIQGWEATVRRSGAVTAARQVLETIEHPAIPYIIEYRSLTRLISALESYLQGVDMFSNRLFYRFTNYCPSGRLYTKDMSVQNLPHEGRVAIVPDPGHVFVSADYDSFELKILSALSGDTYFRKCWEEGIDLHKKVVSDMKGIPYEQVTDVERQSGKALNFGVIYGQEAVGLARKLRISVQEARELIQKYEANVPEIIAFKEECIRLARECGCAETHFGRRRALPNLQASERARRLKAERQAINHPIQGTASDIVKIAMVELDRAGFQIDAMVHDSVLLSVPENEVSDWIRQIRSIMEIDLNGLKLTVSVKAGRTWGGCE